MFKKMAETVSAVARMRLMIAFIGFLVFLTGAGFSAMASMSSALPAPKPQNLSSFKDGKSAAHPIWTQKDIANDILSIEDVKVYKDIFRLLRAGKLQNAEDKIALLNDKRLLGYVQYLKYMHPTAYRSEYTELRSWLKSYNDLPGAEEVYDLATRRQPEGYKAPEKPSVGVGARGSLDRLGGFSIDSYQSGRQRTSAQRAAIHKINRNIRTHIIKGRPTAAWELLNTTENKKLLDTVEFNTLRADIAQSYYLHNKIDIAQSHARAAVMAVGRDAPMAGWIAGLASWRKKIYSDAAAYFETVALTSRASPWMISGGAYWTARAYMKNGNHQEAQRWLEEAARYPYTFYGLLANQSLSSDSFGFDWQVPKVSTRHIKILASDKIGQRAIGLLQIGETTLATKELRQLNVLYDVQMKNAVLAVANEWNLAGLSLQMGSVLTHDNGNLMDAALYPVIPWQPKGGYEVDRALINAFIRQESRFDPTAVSYSGATGLMQLMPVTASYVAGESADTFKTRAGQRRLMQPEYNIALGQKYLSTLMRDSRINYDLFKLAISYNAGPSRMARWERQIDYQSDPLLFIESIPSGETRIFVEHVLANYWIYRIRMGQDLPSLKSAINNDWPLYASQDPQTRVRVAADVKSSYR